MTAETGTSHTGTVQSYYTCYRKKKNSKACVKRNVKKEFENHLLQATQQCVFRREVMDEIAENIGLAYNRKIKTNPELTSLKKQLAVRKSPLPTL